jgi:hypothetical protein
MEQSRSGEPRLPPCNCVLRQIFRICYGRFVHCTEMDQGMGWGHKNEEYVADFCLTARRTLRPTEHRLFRCYFILGADWRLCSAKMGVDHDTFFHEVYRVEQKLGKTFAELGPYPLYPLTDYFSAPLRKKYER